MSHRCCLSIFLLLSLMMAVPSFASDPWLPIPKEDLAMKDSPAFPGAHAVILYRKDERNDKEGWEQEYYRIKILDEQGKEHANVETETLLNSIRFSDFEARTIRPDGSIVPFEGKPVDKLIAKYKGVSLYAKTFTLPDVQVGSIIEYRYRTSWGTNVLYDSLWNVQEWLPVRDADLSLRYNAGGGFGLSWQIYFLDSNSHPKDNNGVVTLTMHNIPGMEKERYMPPEKELRARVEFTYFEGTMKKPDEFWKDKAKEWTRSAEDFMNKKNVAQNEVATVVVASDDPEVKLHKIYDRIQKIRNLTYEHERSAQEQEREKLKPNNNIDDVLKHGYAFHNQLVRTFTALARAAGFEATLIRVTERDQYFAHREIPRWERVSTELAIVQVNGQERFFDPGVPFCPFGLLSWEDTGTLGLVESKDAAVWKETPQPQIKESLRKRTADLQLDRDGVLQGTVTVAFEGQDALYHRLSERDNDESQRKKDLEEMFKDWLPAGTGIELAKVDEWNAATDRFTVTAKVNIPNFASATGKRVMVPISIFPGSDNHPFRHARRVYPIYFRNPYREADEITIKVPDGMQVESLPSARQFPTLVGDLTFTAEKQANAYKINREVVMKGFFFPPNYYGEIRSFLDKNKAIGDEQAVLRASAK